jgi:hypothetical protein
MFHTLARCAADLLVGGPGASKSSYAWQQVYRALEHGAVKNACANGKKVTLLPQEIQDFANTFVTMQQKRHSADYDPMATATKSEVLVDIGLVEKVINDFAKANIKDRRAFVALVIFKQRK